LQYCQLSGLYEDNSIPMCGIVQMIIYGRHLPVPLRGCAEVSASAQA
jgi:hypothetical protein